MALLCREGVNDSKILCIEITFTLHGINGLRDITNKLFLKHDVII